MGKARLAQLGPTVPSEPDDHQRAVPFLYMEGVSCVRSDVGQIYNQIERILKARISGIATENKIANAKCSLDDDEERVRENDGRENSGSENLSELVRPIRPWEASRGRHVFPVA